MKIALIGAGSFVFGPSVLSQALLEHRLDDIELALMDVDAEAVGLMAAVGRRMARETGLTQTRVTAHTDRETALDGADFAIHSASPQMQRRHQIDCDIIAEHAPGHLITEFGGIAGISYSLRQIALVEKIAADMRRLCRPDTWLLSVANPLPRVCQAAHEAGVKAAGFCSVSLTGYQMLWSILQGGPPLSYPYTEAHDALDVTMAGVNHLCWAVSVRDRATGEDLLPTLQALLAQGATSGNPRSEALCRETGYLLVPHDGHTQDFLTPDGSGKPHLPYHGTPEERARRLAYLKAVGDGEADWGPLLEKAAWERPLDFIAARLHGQPVPLHSLNLVNDGQIANLPRGVFVETACTVMADGTPVPQTVTLPDSVLPYTLRTVAVTEAIGRAARERSRARVHEAVDLDPTITDKAAGRKAIDACIAAHADLLPVYH